MRFDQIIGQDLSCKLLQQMASSDRLPHALLLLGPQGCGKKAVALALAQYILCEDQSTGEACGKCHNCVKSSKNIHPDIHFSFPTIGTNATSDQFLSQWRSALEENLYFDVNDWLQRIGADNKQGNIPKEECVNIIRKLSLKTFEGNFKILIMWLPEYLGKEGNRLLKMIEEPPEKTIFILLAENQELILNTILSRCQIVQLNPLSDEAIVKGLVQGNITGKETAEGIAHLADGNFNEALRMAAERENDNAALLLDWLRKCYKGNGIEMVQWSEAIAEIGRENQKQFLRYGLHFFREYLLLLLTGNEAVRLQPKELETARNLTKVISFDQVDSIVRLFTDCAYFVERNANPKVLFLDTSIKMHRIIKRKEAIAVEVPGYRY